MSAAPEEIDEGVIDEQSIESMVEALSKQNKFEHP